MEQSDKPLAEVLRRFQQDDRFAAANGIELVELRPGYARSRVRLDDRHRNCFDLTHAGVIFTLSAVAFAAVCNAEGPRALGVEMNLSCLKATNSGVLEAEAVEISRGRRLAVCTVRVTDAEGCLVAAFRGTACLTGQAG